jgi:hypothetical protein
MKSAMHLPGFTGGFPLAVNAAETPRPGDFTGPGIDHFEQVFSAHRVVDRLLEIPGKRQRLQHDLVEAEYLRIGTSGVEIINAQRLWRRQCA